MAVVTFTCPSCGNAFQAPAERVPAQGARGRCKRCGSALSIFQDGRTEIAGPSATAPPQENPKPEPEDKPVWEIRPQSPNSMVPRGPHRLAEVGRLIVEGQLFEDDQARVYQGAWMPLTAYPALNSYWAQRAEHQRELYGDEDHCALHRERKPGWRCPKCHNYLCAECVVNRPIIEGGAARYLCLSCEMEAQPVRRDKGLKKLIPGVFKK